MMVRLTVVYTILMVLGSPICVRAQQAGVQTPGIFTPYVATGSAMPRSAQDRSADSFSVRDFPALNATVACKGQDDYPAFAAALAQLASTGGGTLRVPAATCLVSQPIVIPGGPVGYGLIKIVGAGPSSVISPTASMAEVINVPSGQVDISDLSLVNVSAFAGAGIAQTKPANNLPTRYSNLRLVGFTKGIEIATGDNFDISSSFFLNNGTAVSLENQCLNGRVRSNYMLGGNGVDLPVAPTQQCEGVAIEHNDILPGANGSFGIRVLSGLQIDLTDNIIDQVTTGPGVILDATNHAVADITIKGGWIGAQGGATAVTNGLQITGSVQYVTVKAVTFVGWLGYDVSVTGSNGFSLGESRLTSTASIGNLLLSGAAANVVTGNTFKHATNSITETGTTTTYATMNVLASTPNRSTTSRYVFNNGDTLGDIDTGHTTSGNSKAMISGGNGTVVYQASGTVNDIFAVLQSKGLGGVLLAPNGTTKLSVNTNFTAIGNAIADQSAQVVTSGATASVAAGAGRVLLKGTSTTFQLTMTAGPTDGQQMLLECDTSVSSLTVLAATGQSMVGTASACSATQGHLWHYRLADTSWHMAY
jgi:hypothetical protein